MTFNLEAWLDKMLENGQRRHERLAFLITANGGAVVRGWGMISFREGGHQSGLDLDDALELIKVAAFFQGLGAAGVDVASVFTPRLNAYRARFGLAPFERTP